LRDIANESAASASKKLTRHRLCHRAGSKGPERGTGHVEPRMEFSVSISGIHHRPHTHRPGLAGQLSTANPVNSGPAAPASGGTSDQTAPAASPASSPSTGASSASSGAATVQAAAASAAPSASTISANVLNKTV
jgi:hypothetical protein